jgi:hypothetical protein
LGEEKIPPIGKNQVERPKAWKILKHRTDPDCDWLTIDAGYVKIHQQAPKAAITASGS